MQALDSNQTCFNAGRLSKECASIFAILLFPRIYDTCLKRCAIEFENLTEINFSQVLQPLESVALDDFNFVAAQAKLSQIRKVLEIFLRNFAERAAACLIELQVGEFLVKCDGKKFHFSIVRQIEFIDFVALNPGKGRVG